LRRAASISLGRLNDDASIPKMIKMLQDGHKTVQSSAVLGLGLSANGRARYTLLHLARGTEYAVKLVGSSSIPPHLRGFAAISLALSDSDGARNIGPVRDLLRNVARDESAGDDVRALALESLGLLVGGEENGGEEAVRFLVDFAGRGKTDYRLVSAAVAAMGKTKNPVVLPHLIRHLKSRHVAVRQSAALGIGSIALPGDEEAVKSLFRCYGNAKDPSLRGFALISMGRIGGRTALKNIRVVLKRNSTSDRAWACLALGLAGQNAPADGVVDDLYDVLVETRSRSTRGAAAIALGLAGGRKASKDLAAFLKKGDSPYVRGYCAMALGMIGDPAAVPLLRTTLAEKNVPEVSNQAAVALCLLNDNDSVFDLTNALISSNSESTKTMAAKSLIFLGDTGVVKRLLEYITTKSSDELTYMLCFEVISRLIMSQKAPYLDRVAADSNYANEFPIVEELLSFGI